MFKGNYDDSKNDVNTVYREYGIHKCFHQISLLLIEEITYSHKRHGRIRSNYAKTIITTTIYLLKVK